GAPEGFECLNRAAAVMAVVDDLGMTVELAETVGKLAQGNQACAVDVGNLPLVRLADVDQDQLVALGLALPPILLDADLHAAVVGFRADAAEGLVVHQLMDGRVIAADRAVGVLSELELAELQPER